jgi:uncharacterized protein with PQ loop repeat
MSDPIHHISKRKRIHEQHEVYPHPNAHKRFVDRIILVVGLVSPLLTAQQSYYIHSSKDATGVSIITFSGFVCVNLIWLWYGLLHKELPIILTYSLLAICNTTVVLGVLMYS